MKTITLDEFISKAEDNGYILKQDKKNYVAYNEITNVYYAINRIDAYDIQFLELSSEEYAHKFFEYNKNDVNNYINSNDYVKTKSNNNYELYHAENTSTYYLVIRSGANIIYIIAPIGYINEIEEFLDDLYLEY